MLEVKEPETRRQSTTPRTGTSATSSKRDSHAATPVTARSTANGAVSRRQPDEHVRLTPIGAALAPKRHQDAPVGVQAPSARRGRKQIDRLVRREARLLTTAVVCTTLVCTLLIVYLAAYAQVASLGIRMSAARVHLRQQRLQSETLRAQVARAASPDRIAQAAKDNGMVMEHTQQICYVNPAGDQSTNPTMGAQLTAKATTAAPNTDGGMTSQNQFGTRMASRGTNSNTLTTAPVTN